MLSVSTFSPILTVLFLYIWTWTCLKNDVSVADLPKIQNLRSCLLFNIPLYKKWCTLLQNSHQLVGPMYTNTSN